MHAHGAINKTVVIAAISLITINWLIEKPIMYEATNRLGANYCNFDGSLTPIAAVIQS